MEKMKSVFGKLAIMSVFFLTVVACKKQDSDGLVPGAQFESNSITLNKSILKVGELSVVTAKLPGQNTVSSIRLVDWEVRNKGGALQPIKERSVMERHFALSNAVDKAVMSWIPAAPGTYTIMFVARYNEGKTIRYRTNVTVTL